MSRARTRAPRDRLQEGIFFRPKERRPPCWRLVLLDVAPGTAPGDGKAALATVARTLAALRAGRVAELRGEPPRNAEATRDSLKGLTALIAYGRSLFDAARHDPRLTGCDRPAYLSYLPSGEAFPELPWAARGTAGGEADVALQLVGHTAATVNRAAVEVWKVIEDARLPLAIVSSFDGFGRPDGRGWLEFHDGVSNIESSQRLDALAAPPDPPWMAGGTYMAFLRLRVDLRLWRSLDRAEQELVVGRDKLTGNPLVAVRRDGTGRARPVAGTPARRRSASAQRAERADPPQTTDPLLESSHIHRANQNRGSPGAPAGLRMFRQGYEFLDSIGPDGPDLGLNFVSFQSDLATLHHVMQMPGWLGDVNFGGPSEPEPGDPSSPRLLSLLAGGLYAVPPRSRPFPGAGLFGRG